MVEVHPAAVTRYLGGIDDLATTLSRRLVEGDEAVASALREPISAWSSIPVAKTNEDRSDGQIGATHQRARSVPTTDALANSGSGARNTLNAHSRIALFQLVAKG